jgi:hypothetical protein
MFEALQAPLHILLMATAEFQYEVEHLDYISPGLTTTKVRSKQTNAATWPSPHITDAMVHMMPTPTNHTHSATKPVVNSLKSSGEHTTH